MTAAPNGRLVLLVDDDDAFRGVMAAELKRRGYAVEAVATGGQALERAARAEADVILLDLRLPDLDGIEVLKRLRSQELGAGVIVLTGHGTIDTAIQAMRLGAYDYLEKPCPIEKVEVAIGKIREHLGLLARQRVLQDGYVPPDVREGMVGASPSFLKLRQSIARVAGSDATTLILGETGAGKELVATLLHTTSARRDAPHVVVDCAALHEELLQSELFGHEKGAFSGAVRRKHGLFEVAHGGTLFLDEVGDTSLETQARLLRVLETGRFRRLGGTQEIAVDVRVISATNRDLPELIAAGRFREDLYFRLSAVTLVVPPLRERREDIPRLVDHFAARLGRRLGRRCRIGREALDLLVRHDWPGNVRELNHVLEQAFLLCAGDELGVEDLPRPIQRGAGGGSGAPQGDARVSLRELERRHVRNVLQEVGGNRARAAEILGISERNVYRLIKKHGWRGESPDRAGTGGAT